MWSEAFRSLRTRAVAVVTVLARGLRDRSGATAIEYGLLCALLFLVFAGSIRYFANSTNEMYDRIATNMR